MHPVKKKRILHAGVDLAAPYGTPVYASGSGKVVKPGIAAVRLVHRNPARGRLFHVVCTLEQIACEERERCTHRSAYRQCRSYRHSDRQPSAF